MSRIYFSIPVIINNRDKVIDMMISGLAGLSKFSKAPFIFDHWKPGWGYDQQSVAKADIFIFTHQNNAFKFNKLGLPSGVFREYEQAKLLGKRIYLAYKTADGVIRFYKIEETAGLISGIAGTTGDLATFLDKSVEYTPKEEICNDDEPFLKFMTNSLPVKEHSIDLRKKVQGTSYDRRLLL